MIVEIVLLGLITFLVFKLLSDGTNMPPGPWHIPYIGSSMPLTDKGAGAMVKKYGDIFTCWMGVVPFVMVADYTLNKEILSLPELSNRPEWRVFSALRGNKLEYEFLGLVSSNGQRWQHNRRFTLRHLRDLGMGKSRLEDAILFEVADLVKYFKALKDEPTEIPFVLNIAILNVIWQLVASHRFDFGDKEVEQFMKNTNEAQSSFFTQACTEFYPILLYIFPKRVLDYMFGFSRLTQLRLKFNSFVGQYVEEHKNTLDTDNPRDYIDEYLIAMNEKKEGEESFFDDDDLLAGLFDLFIAGNDTVAYSTKWLILYMAKYPDVQKRAQEEIDKVVPRDTLPSLEHRASLQYLDALINEVLRASSFLNFGVSRQSINDFEFKGYRIPKGTIILPLNGVAHSDSRYWKDPETFEPERFLDEHGKFRLHIDGHQPFGLGRRQCLGEPLARMELYLITGALLQNFTFSPAPGKEVDLEPLDFPFFNWPKKQKILIKQRV